MNDQRWSNGCSGCYFFKEVDAAHGSCHRFPPAFAGSESPRELHRWRFPLVSAFAWCGEFRPLSWPQTSSTAGSN